MPSRSQRQVASTLSSLFVSFWDISLHNLPEGMLTHCRVTPARAKTLIAHARREHRLVCVSGDDLLAPYCQRERVNHQELCRVLKRHFGISLVLKDFCTS